MMTQEQADALATSHKSFFCDISGFAPSAVDGWIDPSMMSVSLNLVVKTRGFVAGAAVLTFAERIRALDWSVGSTKAGVYFMFRLPDPTC